jgi:cytochrome c oxidase cbb3-type subunit 3
VDLRAVKWAMAMILPVLAACGGPDPAEQEANDSPRLAPVSVRYDQWGAAGDMAPPAEDLVNPFSGDADAAKQGELLFAAMNCDGCHGGGAVGFVGPSLVDGRWRYGGEDGALFHSIFYGRAMGMPAYGGILSDNTVWQLVSYVQSQPVPAAIVPTVAWPSP